MDREWNDRQPIYRQLRDRVVAMILDGLLAEGEALPSVRSVAAERRVNPLTVLKAYQQLVDEGLVESRRGLGMFVTAGAHGKLTLPSHRYCSDSDWRVNGVQTDGTNIYWNVPFTEGTVACACRKR